MTQAKTTYPALTEHGTVWHLSYRNDETLCGEYVSEYVSEAELARLIAEQNELCKKCSKIKNKAAR